MTEAVFVAGIGMWASLLGLVVVGLLGGVILFVSEKIAAKTRKPH